MQITTTTYFLVGSGCGSVGRAVASDTRDPRFESNHRQKNYILNICLLSTVYWKDENKEKEAGNGPFFKNGAKIGAKNWLKMAPNNWNPRSEYYGQRLYEAGLAQTSKKRILRRLFHLLPRYCLRLLLLVLLLILVQVPGSKVQLMDVCIFPSQRILTIGGSITVWLTPCLTGLDAT